MCNGNKEDQDFEIDAMHKRKKCEHGGVLILLPSPYLWLMHY